MKIYSWTWSYQDFRWTPKRERHSVIFHYWRWLGFEWKIQD